MIDAVRIRAVQHQCLGTVWSRQNMFKTLDKHGRNKTANVFGSTGNTFGTDRHRSERLIRDAFALHVPHSFFSRSSRPGFFRSHLAGK
jgi:hypothetical protein